MVFGQLLQSVCATLGYISWDFRLSYSKLNLINRERASACFLKNTYIKEACFLWRMAFLCCFEPFSIFFLDLLSVLLLLSLFLCASGGFYVSLCVHQLCRFSLIQIGKKTKSDAKILIVKQSILKFIFCIIRIASNHLENVRT